MEFIFFCLDMILFFVFSFFFVLVRISEATQHGRSGLVNALQAEGQALPRGPTWWPEKPQTPAPQAPEAIDGHSAHAANS